MNSTAAEPLLYDHIGNNSIELRPLQDGCYIISVRGELSSGNVTPPISFGEATSRFFEVCSKVTSYVFGANHYE